MVGSTDVLELVNFFEMQNTNYEVNSQAESSDYDKSADNPPKPQKEDKNTKK